MLIAPVIPALSSYMARNKRNQEHFVDLVPGEVYTGTVVSVCPVTRGISVQINGAKNGIIDNCIWAAGIFSGLLGFKFNYIPPVGTGVLVVPGPPAFVIGCTQTDQIDLVAGTSKTLTGCGKKRTDTAIAKYLSNNMKMDCQNQTTVASDMLEGELEIGNSLGVALVLLTNLARLQAGGRAKVEVSLINDVVRMVSEAFKHHSAFGDIEIYNDGRLNFRTNGTSYEHEAWGLLNPKDLKAKNKSNLVDLDSIDKFNETGRWRYSEFIGFLGDMVHQFVTEPLDAIGKLAETQARAGKARNQIMADGTILMQSVTEIAIERVTRIPVPMEKKRWDDPEAGVKADMEKLNKDYLKIWAYGKDTKDVAKTCYQLREYARWLSGMHSYARFLQLNKYWDLKSEKDSPKPEWTNKEEDREIVNSGVKDSHIDTYSCFRIMRDGSQVLLDGYGNAYVASYNGVQISSAKHLDLYSAGDISMTSGQNIYMKARRNVELVAVVGGLKMKARTWFHGLCEWGTLWLKSDAIDPEDGDPPDPDDEVEDPKALVMDRAIILETTKGRTIVSSEKELILETKRPGDEDKSDIVIQTSTGANLRMISGKDINIKGRGQFVVKVTREIVFKGLSIICDLMTRTFSILKTMKVSAGSLHVSSIKTFYMRALKSIAGPKRERGYPKHENHIDTIGSSVTDPEFDTELPDTEANDTVEALTSGTWDFNDQGEYVYGGREMYETLSEQRVRMASETSGEYKSWSLAETALRATTRTGSKAPFPGSGSVRWTHSGGEPLYKPSERPYSASVTDATAFNQQTITYQFLRRVKV